MKCNHDRSQWFQFNGVANEYHDVRPTYPSAVFDETLTYANLDASQERVNVLDVGAGTGQATQGWIAAGCRVLTLEPGESLSHLLQKHTQSSDRCQVFTGKFEQWPLVPESFDIVSSATAFHWVDPAVGYRKAFDALKPGGVFAPFWVMLPTTTSAVEQACRAVFQEWVPSLIESHFGDCPNDIEPFQQQGVAEMLEYAPFQHTSLRRFECEQRLMPKDYCRLLATYANFAALDGGLRAAMFADLVDRLARIDGGEVVLSYTISLLLATKALVLRLS